MELGERLRRLPGQFNFGSDIARCLAHSSNCQLLSRDLGLTGISILGSEIGQ